MADSAAPQEDDNPFAGMAEEARQATANRAGASWGERFSLNAGSSFRGTLEGRAIEGIARTGREAVAEPPVDFGNPMSTYVGPAEPNANAAEFSDMMRTSEARYQAMPEWNGPLEGLAALSGQLVGAAFAPSSWVTRIPGITGVFEAVGSKFATPLISRIFGAAGTQGVVAGASDVVGQHIEMATGLRDHYDKTETAIHTVLGAGLGGAIHGGTEAVAALRGASKAKVARLAEEQARADEIAIAAQRVAQEEARLRATVEDPSLRSANDPPPMEITVRPSSVEPVPVEAPPAVETPVEAPVAPEPVVAAPEEPYVPPMTREIAPPVEAPVEAGKPAKAPKERRPLSMIDYIARNGGIELTQEARDMGLHKMMMYGGPVARKNGRSIDGFWRERLMEEGYLPADADGYFARDIRDELYEAARKHQQGEKTYSVRDQAIVDRQTADKAFKVDEYAQGVEAEAKKLGDEFVAVGLGRREDLDPRAAYDAAELVWRGEETDHLVAYERAVMMRSVDDPAIAKVAQDADIPFEAYRGTARQDGGGDRGAGFPGDRGSEAGPNRQGQEPSSVGARGEAVERTAAGDQRLIPGVEAVTDRQRAEVAGSKPLTGGDAPPPAGGLFDTDARNQGFMFRRAGGAEPAPETTGATTAHIQSLQEQVQALAKSLNAVIRQGRLRGGKETLGQYDVGQDVIRVRNVADIKTAAHEAAHSIEDTVGQPLTDIITAHAGELRALDYDASRMNAREGYAEFINHSIVNPAYAEKQAPAFRAAFREFMVANQPEMLAALDEAAARHTAWKNAPSDVQLGAMVKTLPSTAWDKFWDDVKQNGGFAKTIGIALGRAYETTFDNLSPVALATRDMARMIKQATGIIPRLEGSDNPEVLARLAIRSHQAAQRDMMDGVRPYRQIKPEGPSLHDALARATGQVGRFAAWDSPTLKTFSDYLAARRALVLWDKHDAGLIPNRPVAMSRDDLARAIAELEGANPTFNEAGQMVHDYNQQLLKKAYDAGHLPKEQYVEFAAETFYVPMMRDLRDKPLASSPASTSAGPKSEGPGAASLIKRLQGSDRDIIDPIQSIITKTFLYNRAIAHNDVALSLLNLGRQAIRAGATGVGRIVEEVPVHQVIGQQVDVAAALRSAARQAGVPEQDIHAFAAGMTDMFGDDPIMGTIFRREPVGKRGEPILLYKEGGETRAMRVVSRDEGRALYEALTEMPAAMRDWAVQIGATSASMLRAGIVTNPVYAFTNFIRDQLATTVLRKDYVPFNPRGLVREVQQGDIAQMYVYAGGVSPGSGAAGLSEMMNQHVDALSRKGWAVQRVGDLRDFLTKADVKAGARAVAETISLAESGTRLNLFETVFKQKKGQGLSDYDAMLEAAYQSTDLMDFGRHGSKVQTMRALVPFINSHLQGLDKARRTMIEPLLRAARGDIVTTTEQEAVKNAGIALFKMTGIGGALGYAYSALMADHPAYRDANEELRATHLILPGSLVGQDGKILVIPKPFELAMGFNLGEMAGLGVKTGDPRAAEFALAGASEVLLPPNVLNSIPIFKTFAELTLNRSFFTKRNIVPDSMLSLPVGQQAGPRTSELAKLIGEKINVAPIKVDYAIGSTFGLWGKDLLAASNATNPDLPEAALEDSMFLRRFIKSADAASETTKQYWKLAAAKTGEFARSKEGYDKLRQDFKDDDAQRFLSKLEGAKRAYVTLFSGADEEGRKAKFTAEEKKLHPLVRGAAAVNLVNSMVKDLTINVGRSIETGERTPKLDPRTQRQAIEQLRILSAMEMRNALTMIKERGYEDRKPISTEDQFKTISAISPQVGQELATRFATAKIPSTETIARLWPEAHRRLLTEGSQANLKDLAMEAKVDGPAFGGDRVKKAPAKRRGPIPAQP